MDTWIELDLKYLPRTQLQQVIVSVTLAVMYDVREDLRAVKAGHKAVFQCGCLIT